ncbi:hypothetical protein Tco_1274682, partial [Tanacetum coccineum]
LGTSVNVMPKSIFKHLKVANLKENDIVVEMADMTEKFPLGIVENILAFLATIHAHIDIFNREISLGIGEDRVLFDMDGGVYHFKIPVEKVYMANFVQEEEYFNPLKIEDAELEVKHEDMVQNLNLDHERQTVDGNRMIITDFHKVRYGNKTIDDTTQERRYYEWVAQNSHFNDNGVSHEATMYENPCKYHHEYPLSYFPQKDKGMPKPWGPHSMRST